MTNGTMTSEMPPFVFRSILPHIVLAIVLVVLLVSHFVHHHCTQRKHYRSTSAEEASDADDEADVKATPKNKMVMVVSPMMTRSEEVKVVSPMMTRSEEVKVVSPMMTRSEEIKAYGRDKTASPGGSKIDVMEYAVSLQNNIRETIIIDDDDDDDVSVDETPDCHRNGYSETNNSQSAPPIRSSENLWPASSQLSQSNLMLNIDSPGQMNSGQGKSITTRYIYIAPE